MAVRRSNRRLLLTAAIAAFAVVAISLSLSDRVARMVEVARFRGVVNALKDAVERPNVSWPTGSPADHGLDSRALESMDSQLAPRGTDAFLVARNGRLVHEWYSPRYGANMLHYTAALAKAVTATSVALAALSDSVFDLTTRAAEYLPSWKDDSLKSTITVAHLLSHRSGLENIPFQDGATGWRDQYYRESDTRFPLAISQATLLSAPGEQQSYSGIGFYILSYTLSAALREAGHSDLRDYLATRVLRPLGVPDEAWRLSYGEMYEFRGLRLYAIGSGGAYTARAFLRIGQLVLRRGRFDDQQILDSRWVDTVLTHVPSRSGNDNPPAGLGWWMNTYGQWPSLPRDALAGSGNGNQIVLVVPSLDLVAVRFGDALEENPENSWLPVERHLFMPLMLAVGRDGSGHEARARMTDHRPAPHPRPRVQDVAVTRKP